MIRLDLTSSPRDMYLYSLETKEKLPEHLHEAMMLWSFHPDPEIKEYVKMYLDWTERCEVRRKYKEKFERRILIQEKILSVMAYVCGVSLLILLLF